MTQQQNFYGMNNMNPMMYAYGNMQGTNMPNQQMPSMEPPKKERLRVKMSIEEKSLFGNLFNLADKQMKGRLEGKEAAQFLKKSGCSTDILKKIWMISAQTDANFLEKEEFYVALRLIALAQNNMEVSDEAIRFNSPLPPLPVMDLREKKAQEQNINSSTISTNQSMIMNNSIDQSVWIISDEDNKKYSELFNKNKDMDNKITINKAFEMFKKSKIAQEKLVKILSLIPSVDTKTFQINEFKVIIHLIYKCYSNLEVPNQLPEVLQKVIMDGQVVSTNQSMDFMNIIKPNSVIKQQQPEASNVNINFLNQNMINPPIIDPSNNAFGNFSNVPNITSQTLPLTSRNDNLSSTILPPNESFIVDNKPAVNHNNFTNINTSSQVRMNSPILTKSIIQPSTTQNKTLSFDNLKPIQNNMQNLYQESLNENTFLIKLLEEDQILLDNLTEDLSRIIKNTELINEKNSSLKNKILEIRRKINLERDNLAKANMNLQNKTNELINTTNEYVQINEESNKMSLQNQPMNNPYMMNNNMDRSQQKSPTVTNSNFNQEKLHTVTNANFNQEKLQPTHLPSSVPINNSFNQAPNTAFDRSQFNVNSYNNNTTFNQPQNVIDEKTQFNANMQTNKNLSVNQNNNQLNNMETKSQDPFNSSNKLGLDGFGPSNNKSINSDQLKNNLQNFNSSDVVKVQNSTAQFCKSPNLSSNNIFQVKQNEVGNKSFERFEQTNTKNEMKFDFDDNTNKGPTANNVIKKPEQVPSKSGFDFGFSMGNKNENNNFQPPKTAFDMSLGKPDQVKFEQPKTDFDMNFDKNKHTANNTNDFGMYPTFEKKTDSKKFNDGFEDFGNFGDDFGNFESDFKKAQKDKDFFNDNNWGDFK